MSPTQNTLSRKIIAILALTSQSMAIAATATAATATDPAVHAGKGMEAGALDATAEAKTRVRLLVTDQTQGARAQGFAEGFRSRADQLISAEFQRGHLTGEPEGTHAGRREGRIQGEENGRTAGDERGLNEGYEAANRDAHSAGTARGSEIGRREAHTTDSAARGTTAGKIQGDREAKSTAQEREYGPAREQYSNERYAERVNSQSTIELKKGLSSLASLVQTTVQRYSHTAMSKAELAVENFLNDPTVPHVPPTKGAEKAIDYCKGATTDAPADYQSCVDIFVKAYNDAFTAAFPGQFLANHREQWPREYDMGLREGINSANSDRGVRSRTDDAFASGRQRGFDEGYRLSYDYAYRAVYDTFFEQSRSSAYTARYEQVYATLEAGFAEQARAAAFEQEKAHLYNTAFEAARVAEFNAKYAGYASQVKAQAKTDGAKDFEQNPVRLTSELKTLESIADGILEPAENLSLAFTLRNFSSQSVEARDIDLRAVAVDTNGIAVSEPHAILTQALAPKSVTTVKGAFTVQLSDAALKTAKSLKVKMSYKGRVFSESMIALQAKTLTRVELAERPETRLGYPGVIKMKVTNQSTKVLPEESILVLDTRVEGITFQSIQAPVSKLAPGQTTTVEFPFMNNSYGWSKPVAFVATLTSKSGRLTGALNQSQELPALKDYEVKVVKGDLDKLVTKGRNVVRIQVRNVSTNASVASVTVESSIVAEGGADFEFIKGGKVVYKKISPGNYGEQKITVKAEQKNGHGKFVMKVTVGDKFLGYFEETF